MGVCSRSGSRSLSRRGSYLCHIHRVWLHCWLARQTMKGAAASRAKTPPEAFRALFFNVDSTGPVRSWEGRKDSTVDLLSLLLGRSIGLLLGLLALGCGGLCALLAGLALGAPSSGSSTSFRVGSNCRLIVIVSPILNVVVVVVGGGAENFAVTKLEVQLGDGFTKISRT